jgi:hypothetical protein
MGNDAGGGKCNGKCTGDGPSIKKRANAIFWDFPLYNARMTTPVNLCFLFYFLKNIF